MTPIKQLNLPPSEVQSLNLKPKSLVRRLNPLALARTAIDDARISRKSMAIEMGISAELLSYQLSDDAAYHGKHLSMRRLGHLTDNSMPFWRAFAILLCKELGMRVERRAGGSEAEQQALADVQDAIAKVHEKTADYLRAVGR